MRCLLLLVCLAPMGCALTSKADPIEPRYYSPEASLGLDRPAAKETTGPELRLRRVRAAEHLKSKIVYRDTDHEYGFHEERRWTEDPAAYLERVLAHVLYEERGLRRAMTGKAPTLEVELTAFEELRHKPGVRVSLVVVLHDDRHALLEETITVEAGVSGDEEQRGEAVAKALGESLRKAVDQATAKVQAQLQRAKGP